MRPRLAAIVLIAGLLAACTSNGSDPKPSATPPTAPVTTTTAPRSSAPPSTPSRTGPLTTGPGVKPGEKPPVLDAVGRQHTAAGALLFAAYYFAAFSWGYLTNDSYLVEQISAPGCDGCRKYIVALKALIERGGELRGGRVVLNSISQAKGRFELRSDYVFDASLHEEPVVISLPSAAPSTAQRRLAVYHALTYVSWQQGRWKVIEVSTK